ALAPRDGPANGNGPDTGALGMTKATDTIHRGVPLPEPLRQAMQQARAARGQTNAAFVAGAVADHLPRLVESLQALGYGKLLGKRRPARLPSLTEAGDAAGVAGGQRPGASAGHPAPAPLPGSGDLRPTGEAEAAAGPAKSGSVGCGIMGERRRT